MSGDTYVHVPVAHLPFAMNIAMTGPPPVYRVFCRACGEARPRDIGGREFADLTEAQAVAEAHWGVR